MRDLVFASVPSVVSPIMGTSNSRLPRSAFVFLVLLGMLQARMFSLTMPPVVATHFGRSGAPNGFQSQSQFFTLEMVQLAVSLFLAFGVPWFIGAMPVSMINVPNKALAGTGTPCADAGILQGAVRVVRVRVCGVPASGQ
jgi:hypothetical protein